MQFEIDITMRMNSGSRGGDNFLLRSRFATTDRALVLFGPSGSGKTLSLKAIAGLLTPDDGHIRVNGKTIFDARQGVNIPTRERRVGYVFQNYALFPHLTVRENVGFGLRGLFGRLSSVAERRVRELVHIFGLDRVADLRPGALSGGQQQRAALARALAPEPELLLLDEPFSALDQPLRLRMRTELARTLERFAIPMIMVTHDSDEMASFAEAVVVYRDGAVVGVHSTGGQPEHRASVTRMVQQEVALAYDM